MPKGPNGQKRPGDVIGAAIKVAKIATGEIEEPADPKEGKRAAGKKGAAVRAKTLTARERSEIASVAATARWKKS